MTDTIQDTDDAYDPSLPQDDADYNPESISYDPQDDDDDDDQDDHSSAQQEADAQDDDEPYPSDDAPGEQVYDPASVESATSHTKSPSAPPQPSQSPITAVRSPIASRSPGASRSPTSVRQYDPMDPQDALHPMQPQPQTSTTNDFSSIASSETFQSPPAPDLNDSNAFSSTPAAPTAASAADPSASTSTAAAALPKSVDLQALLAGLVPARSKMPSNSPPQARTAPAQAHPQPVAQGSGNFPPPAMNLPPDVMYQLQNLGSPPPQSHPFQPPHPQQQVPPQPQPQPSGPVDIQPEDLILSREEEYLYEKFLENEREIVQTARWDQFAPGSRMFIGNLPTDKIGKKDIFRLFYPYGRLAQISMKQAYGFVQFYEKQDCDNAIRAQQGMILTGRKVHLEISKPQKGKGPDVPRGGGAGSGRGQRERSPFARDRSPVGRGRGRNNRGGRDDFDRGRQPSGNFSPPGRFRDDRRFSRSRSPPGRYRSPSPPRRPSEPPEVALIVTDDPDRGYIHHVEDLFADRRIRTETIFISPRTPPIPDLTRELVVDGVLAIVFLSRHSQDRRKLTMQTFQRNPHDPGAIKWDEYKEIDLPIAVDLVVAMKRGPISAPQPPPQPAFPGYPPQYPPAAASIAPSLPVGVNPNLANIIGSMNPATLQKVFGALAQQPVAPPPQPAYGYQPPIAQPGIGGLQGFGGQRPPAQAPAPTQQVQDIMAQLAALSKKQ